MCALLHSGSTRLAAANGLELRLRADVQEQAVARVDAAALFCGHYVSVADAGHREHRPLGADDDPALVHQRLVEPSAQHLHGQQAARRDAPDHAAEFVHVRVHHDARPCGALRSDDGSKAVEPH